MKILLLAWMPASWQSVVRFTSQMLSEQGHSVDLLSRTLPSCFEIPGSVDFGERATVHPIGHGLTGWRGRLDYVMFLRTALGFARILRPDAIIGYDMRGAAAAYLARLACPGARLVYHNLDLASKNELSSFGRLVKRVEEFSASIG